MVVVQERQVDERLARAATETLCHWRVTLDFEMNDVRPFIHKALPLADNAVRREPDVPTLLNLVADRVVRYQRLNIIETTASMASLPAEVLGLLEAKQTELRNKG
jgi:hypothetical protein